MLDYYRIIIYLYSMNKLDNSKRTQIISLLVEGNSLRATSRITGCSINTVTKLLVDVGRACEKFHEETVRNVKASKIQADETWSFVYSKKKNTPEAKQSEAGDVWTWVGMDAESKLVLSWFVGDRSADSAFLLMQDIASRLASRVQLTTDAHNAYLTAVDDVFGYGIDYAQLIKVYGKDYEGEKRYSPAECLGTKTRVITGNPEKEHISTSYIERQNLTMRMHMRRFTRLTNAFSKKLENHCLAIALHFCVLQFCEGT